MEKHIELYHGTTSISAIKILKSNGILPRSISNNKNEVIDTTTKQMTAVYLTRKKDSAISYGYNRIDNRGWSAKDNELVLPVVFTILINTEKDPLYIDEDYIIDDLEKKTFINFLIKNKVINESYESKDWLYFYENNPKLAFEILELFDWQDSLKRSGSVTFKGNIPLKKIRHIDIYYNSKEFIRLENNTLDDLYDTYNKCCEIILDEYKDKYDDESDSTALLPTPDSYEILKYKNNKLDGTIYKNINEEDLNKLNDFCEEYDYQNFDKIVITKTDSYYMQYNSYINNIDNINEKFSTNKYLILDLEDIDVLSISYFTYIRNSIGMLIKNKELINKFGKDKCIIFEMKYHDIKFFKSLDKFWNFVYKVEGKDVIIPAKKEADV